MARVKGAVHAKKHHRAILEQAQGYYGNKSRSFRAANEQVMHSMQYAYRDRRARKGDFRQLWIQRINAAARLNGMSYSRFIAGLHRADVEVDRKVLADLAVTAPEAFASLVQVANDALATAAAERRGRFLTQSGLAFTHQRVRRLRQLLRKGGAAGRRAGGGRRGCGAAVGGAGRRSRRRGRLRRPRGGGRAGRRRGDRSAVLAGGGRVFDLAPGVMERVASTVTPQPLLAVVSYAPGPARRPGRAPRWSWCASTCATRATSAPSSGRPTPPASTPWCAATGRSTRPTRSACGPRPARCSTCRWSRAGAADDALAELAARGFTTVATVVRGGTDYVAFDWTAPGRPGARQRGRRPRRRRWSADARRRGDHPDGRAGRVAQRGVSAAVLCFEALRQRRSGAAPGGGPARSTMSAMDERPRTARHRADDGGATG